MVLLASEQHRILQPRHRRFHSRVVRSGVPLPVQVLIFSEYLARSRDHLAVQPSPVIDVAKGLQHTLYLPAAQPRAG